MSEEEVELRDLVAQTLENNGILSKIRAELRASVFLALEEQESVMDPAQFTNKPLKAFLSTTEGSVVACLVREFLEFFKLDFTLAVFDPETSHGKYYNYGGRSKLMKDLHLENTNGKKGPLLVHILQIALGLNSNSSTVKKDGGKLNGAHTPPSVNLFAQSSMLLDTTPPSNARGEKILMPQTLNNTVPKANVTFETKPPLEIVSKHSLETTVIPKLKDINILTEEEEEASPRSFSVSEHEQVSQGRKSKTPSSSETTPCNSPSLEKSFSHSKHLQPPSNTESVHHTSKSDSKKDQSQQQNKPNIELSKKAVNSGLSSLSNLPPLQGVGFPSKQPAATLPAINKQIKSIIDLGLETQDNNYDEDFNSTASASVKEDPTYHGTDSEIEEELGSGVDDLLSSTSAVDDLTADVSLSNLTGAADYIEDVKLK